MTKVYQNNYKKTSLFYIILIHFLYFKAIMIIVYFVKTLTKQLKSWRFL